MTTRLTSQLSSGNKSPPKKRPHTEGKLLTGVGADFKFDFAPFYESLAKADESSYLAFMAKYEASVKVSDDPRPLHQRYAELALKLYNETKGEEYEYLDIRSKFPIPAKKLAHVNFFARLKGSPGVHLFYAEIDISQEQFKVVSCSFLNSYPKYPRYVISDDIIIHPDDVTCYDCDEFVMQKFECWDDSD